MKTFKELILEIARKDPQGEENNPRRGEEFDNYINAMFGDMRGDVQRPWTSKPSKVLRKPKVRTVEQMKRKRQNRAQEPVPVTDESHLSWFRDKIGSHLPYTYGVPTSENMQSMNLPVRGIRDHDKYFIIDVGADSYVEKLKKHNIRHGHASYRYHPLSQHAELYDHLTKIGAISVPHGGVGIGMKPTTITIDHGNPEEDRDPTLSVHIPKQHVLNAYKRRTP